MNITKTLYIVKRERIARPPILDDGIAHIISFRKARCAL